MSFSTSVSKNPLARLATGLLISCSFSVSADYQNNNSAMETMVVTASGFEQILAEAPATISIIDSSQIENRAYKDITDVLKDVAGVTVKGGGSRQDITILGMPAQYTALLVDGRKQTGRESQPNGSGGFEQDWLPPLEAIERIEIVRGPMSTLYGSDAIGGVINVITKKNYQQWHANIRLETTLQTRDESGTTAQGQLYLAGPIIKDVLSVAFNGLYQQRDEDEIERGYGEKNLANYRGVIHYTASDSDQISIDFSQQDQKRTATQGLSLPSRSNTSETNNNRQAIALSHNGNYEVVVGNTYIQREQIDNVGREITIENLIFNSQWAVPLDEHLLTLGVSYQRADLEDLSTNTTEVTRISNRQWSMFGENQWSITDNFSLTLGLRVDDNNQFSKHLSPRIYGVWNINENWLLKSGISTGYKAPGLRDTSENWVRESRGGDIYGNVDLTPETSMNNEIGLYYLGENKLTTSLTVFHNSFDDKITLAACPSERCAVEDARYNINIDEAETYGAELSASMGISESLSIKSSYTYTHSEQSSGENEGLPLTQIPLHLAAINANWSMSAGVNSWLRWTYRGEESKATVINSRAIQAPSVSYVDMGGNWQATSTIKVMLGIYNLFDEEVTYEEFGYVEDGRRYWLAVETKF